MDANPKLTRRAALPIAGAAGLAAVFAARGEQAKAAPASTTKVGLPYTVISEPTDAAVQAGLKAWRADFNGAFPLTRLLFGFNGTANLTTPLDAALGTTQIQGARWEGLAKRGTQLRWSDATTPVMTAYGLFRNFRFADWTFASGVKGAKGVLFRSDVSPKNDTDGRWTDIEWTGSWDYGLCLAGDSNANENSEVGFYGIGLGNDASFDTAWLWVGANGNAQENQFLNYSVRDCKFEGSHGDYLRFDRGGHVTLDGFNSFIHTGQANGGSPAGRMIYLPRGGNGDSVMKMTIDNARAELRKNAAGGTDSTFLDSAWSGRGTINLSGVDLAGNANQVGSKAGATIKLRDNARVFAAGLEMVGHIGLYGKAAPRVVLINTDAPGSQAVDATKTTDSAGSGIIRTYDTASAANVKIM